MPSHLHPRSLTTTSLFTTTLFISFLVVAAPHLFPCPVAKKSPPRLQSNQDNNNINEFLSSSPSSHNTIKRHSNKPAIELPLPTESERKCPIPRPKPRSGREVGKKVIDMEEGVLIMPGFVEEAVASMKESGRAIRTEMGRKGVVIRNREGNGERDGDVVELGRRRWERDGEVK